MNLYLKYRPTEFKQIIGNEETIEYLENILPSKKRPHVFLLHGPSGCGKTTLARIIANSLEVSNMDFIEINSADFRGIDTVREMIRNSSYHSIGGKDRLWIIDEVHKATIDAQNALLKLLEDTPKNAYYVLCTTDPEKLLKTVRGRCIQLKVQELEEKQMYRLLKKVVKSEGEKIDSEVYETIIRDSFGSPRNALQILDKVLAVSDKSRVKVAEQAAVEYIDSIQLCRDLIKGSSWNIIRSHLRKLKKQDSESIRRHILGYSQSILLNEKNDRAAFLIEQFYEPFYNVGFPGLVYACYTVIRN